MAAVSGEGKRTRMRAVCSRVWVRARVKRSENEPGEHEGER